MRGVMVACVVASGLLAAGCAWLPGMLLGCAVVSNLDGERVWLRPLSSADAAVLASTPRVHIPRACWYTNETNTRGHLVSTHSDYPMSFEYRAVDGEWVYVGFRQPITLY